MSHRIWWLIAFCVLGFGVAIERDAPGPGGDASSATAAVAAPVTLARRHADGGA